MSDNARKIIFLDIDGVLVTQKSLKKTRWDECRYARLDAKCVCNLNRLIALSAADIVLSSSWRGHSNAEFDRVADYLVESGVSKRAISKTPFHADGDRGCEILEWINDEEVAQEQCVILDDDSDMGSLCNRLVKTDMIDGLTKRKATYAAKLLTTHD